MPSNIIDGANVNFSTDPLLDIAKGKVPGESLVEMLGRNPTTGTSFSTHWGPGGAIAYIAPTANETWEIVSTSANDTSAGTGATNVLVVYLDSDYVEKTIIAVMNGTSAVTLNADMFRLQNIITTGVGSTKFNEGTITVRVSGGGNIRGEIPFVIGDRGFSVSQDGIYSVPAGKMAFGLQVAIFFPKGVDGAVRLIVQTDGGPMIVGGEFPFYQASANIPIIVPIPLPAKTDIIIESIVGTATASTIAIVDFNLVDV